jgi:hypothetical protein
MANTYSEQTYIDLGYTKEEAILKVKQNRESTGSGIVEFHKNKRFNMMNVDNSLTLPEMLEFEGKISKYNSLSYPVIKKIIFNVKESKNISINECYKLYIESLEKFKKAKRSASTTEMILFLYGENSKQYKDKLQLNKNCATCSFEKFSKDYDDIELAKIDFKEKYGSNNINGIMKRDGVSKEEAEHIVYKRGKQISETHFNKPEEERIALGKSKSLSLDNYISKFGVIIGMIEYQKILEIRNGQGNLEFYIERHGVEEGTIIYNEKKGRHKIFCCKEYWMENGHSEEESLKILDEYFKQRNNFSLDYCVSKYGKSEGYSVWKARTDLWMKSLYNKSEEEISEMNSKKGWTVENCKRKYGELEGPIIYRQRLEKMALNERSFTRSSKEANIFFLKLYKNLRKLGVLKRK